MSVRAYPCLLAHVDLLLQTPSHSLPLLVEAYLLPVYTLLRLLKSALRSIICSSRPNDLPPLCSNGQGLDCLSTFRILLGLATPLWTSPSPRQVESRAGTMLAVLAVERFRSPFLYPSEEPQS